MARIAIISDIHSNIAALEAVLKDIDAQKVDAIYCLGDVVGYGPQPVEAMTRILDVCQQGKVLLGNHDHASIYEPIGFNAAARGAALWTNKQIRAGLFSWLSGKKKRWEWLKALPTTITEGDVLFVHASPRNHLEEYVLEEHTQGRSYLGEDPRQLLEENFALVPKTCFVGHTHRPGVFTADRCFLAAGELPDGYDVSDGKYLINVGSVGQPRDRDPRACYTLFSGDAVYFRRVSYDIDAVAKRVRAIPELDPRFADRLFRGE
jgi:predicted phosphodiesterase